MVVGYVYTSNKNSMDSEENAVRESDIFPTIERIDKKLKSLEKILSPILNPTPKASNEKSPGSTQLSSRLHAVEDNITFIIDSVNL